MDDQRLVELLRLVDDPISEPVDDDFKRRLRSELDKTLHHGGPEPQSVQLVQTAPTEQSTRGTSLLLVAVAATVTVISLIAVVVTRSGHEPAPADQPTPTPTTSTTSTTIAAITDAETACERYVGVAEPIRALFSFARDPSASVPDFVATQSALDQLVVDATAGGFLSTDVIDALELASGALAEAQREAEAGDLPSASASTQLAALTLTDQVRSGSVRSCFP